MQENLYNPKDHVIMKGEQSSSILYVARGVIIEKNGEYMNNRVDHMRIGRGRIACLQNLLSDAREGNVNRSISDVYCHHASMVAVVPLDLHYLQDVLRDSQTK